MELSIEASLRSRLTYRAEWKARIDICHKAEPLKRLYEEGDRLSEKRRVFLHAAFQKHPQKPELESRKILSVKLQNIQAE